MGFLIYNDTALFALIFGAAAGLAAYSAFGSGSIATLAGGLALVLFDLYHRFRNSGESLWLVHPDAGGHVWFMPIWIVGSILLAAGIAERLGAF
jgi:hypothetical protein